MFFALPEPPPEMQAVFTMHIVPFFALICKAKTVALRVHRRYVRVRTSTVLCASATEGYPSTYRKGYIALGGLDTPLGLPLDMIARSTADDRGETTLQQAVAYLSELVATKGRTLRNL